MVSISAHDIAGLLFWTAVFLGLGYLGSAVAFGEPPDVTDKALRKEAEHNLALRL